MGAHPPFFLVSLLPSHPLYPGGAEADAKWRRLDESTAATITSRLCLLPVSSPEESLPVALHPDHSSLFYVQAAAAAAHGGTSAHFDFLSHDLICFEESVWAAKLHGLRNSCRTRAGVTAPHTCNAIISLPSEFRLSFDMQHHAGYLRSRVLYKAVVELSLTIHHLHGEPSVVELMSPIFFTAFRLNVNFAYLVQAEGAFATKHLETHQSLVLVAQWRENSTQHNSFYLPNRYLVIPFHISCKAAILNT
jgi:hypothetical protein